MSDRSSSRSVWHSGCRCHASSGSSSSGSSTVGGTRECEGIGRSRQLLVDGARIDTELQQCHDGLESERVTADDLLIVGNRFAALMNEPVSE